MAQQAVAAMVVEIMAVDVTDHLDQAGQDHVTIHVIQDIHVTAVVMAGTEVTDASDALEGEHHMVGDQEEGGTETDGFTGTIIDGSPTGHTHGRSLVTAFTRLN